MTAMNEAITMVMLPQPVWEELLHSIATIKAKLEVTPVQAQAGTPERIPIVAFKNNKSLAERYGVSYSVVRDLALKGRLKTYCDDNRERGRWTTHSDLVAYFDGVKQMGLRP
ncbi:MAG: hypothetical protein LBL94_06500 [Prevotellaceae bacterium]|nr:hypothetical protein [Prevotellaceae bacterium]